MMIITLLFTYNSILRKKNMTLCECLRRCTRICNETRVILSGDICLHKHLWGRSALSVRRGRRMHKEQIEATHTHNDFTQLRAAWMRKTLLLHVWLILVLALERKKIQ